MSEKQGRFNLVAVHASLCIGYIMLQKCQVRDSGPLPGRRQAWSSTAQGVSVCSEGNTHLGWVSPHEEGDLW